MQFAERRGSDVHSPDVEVVLQRKAELHEQQGHVLDSFINAALLSISQTPAWPELTTLLKRRQLVYEAAAAKSAVAQEVERRRTAAEEKARQIHEVRRAQMLEKAEAARLTADKAEEESLLASLHTRKYWLGTETAFNTSHKPKFFSDYTISPPRRRQLGEEAVEGTAEGGVKSERSPDSRRARSPKKSAVTANRST